MSFSYTPKNHVSVTQYISWVKLVNKTLHKYENWLGQFGSLHKQWKQTPQNSQLATSLHICQPHFCCMVTGGTAAGKSYFINHLLTSTQPESSQNQSTQNQSAPAEADEEIPCLSNQAVTHSSTKEQSPEKQSPEKQSTEKQSTANHAPTSSTEAEDTPISFRCETSMGGTSITPVLLMYDPSVPPSFYFLSSDSYAQDISFAELVSMRTSLGSRLKDHWKMTLCQNQKEITKAQNLINTTVLVSPDTAKSYGFHADLLPTSEGYVSIPAWRMVVVNLPHPLLAQGMSLLDTPASDSLYHHKEDMAVLASSSSVIYQLINTTKGMTTENMHGIQHVQQLASSHCLLPQYVLNHTEQLAAHAPDKLTAMSEHLTQYLTQQMAQHAAQPNSAVESTVYQHITEVTQALENLAQARTQAIKSGLIHPLLKQLIKQSKTLTDDISHYEQHIAQETSIHDDLHRQKVHLEDDVAKRSENITEIQAIFAQSDMEQIYQHLMSVYSEESFQRYEERARSMFSSNAEENDDSIVANVENAKNIILSGLKLDMRRTGSSISKINNSMRALYTDLKDNFQDDDLSLTVLLEKIAEMESQSIIANHTLEETFDSAVLMPLKTAFLAQMRTIKKWHSKHKRHLNDPLKFMKNDLESSQDSLKQLTNTINQHTNNINEANNMLTMCHQAAADLLNISHQFNDLLDEQAPVLT